MCRSIQKLHKPAGIASPEEIQAAALQYVRKVSGYRVPARHNRQAFEQAVAEISESTRLLLEWISENGAKPAVEKI